VSAPDTIVAIASPPGRGAVGILRVSGGLVPQLARELLGLLPQPRRALLADFLDSEGRCLDRGLALYFPEPDSFTGEHVLELQGHGGAVVMDLVQQRLLALGCRAARPGEFSERAFLNGKMDIAQAEAVADLIDAGTAAAARAAARSMQGDFSARIHGLKALLMELRTHVEAAIDFSDEDIEPMAASAITRQLAQVFESFRSIVDAARQGTLLREGLTVVIAGKPNAGKSSLLNRLVGEEVAIVTAAPGTTRDLLRHSIEIDGLPVHLIDTAGLRLAADEAEEEGVRRARIVMRKADHILHVVDAAAVGVRDGTAADELPPDVPATRILNKIDLIGAPPCVGHEDPVSISLSARTGAGIDLLRERLKASAGYRPSESGALAARRRHLDALQRALALTQSAAEALHRPRAFELFAEDLKLAQQALGEITGEVSSEDLLGAIFASFCIGK